jgi:hypothetical protein
VNATVQCLLDSRRERTARHPFYQWLRTSCDTAPANRLALPLRDWTAGLMGYRDLCLHALRYRHDVGLAREVNAWAAQLSGHSAVLLADWDALGMNQRLGWTASETLRWVYLDPHTDAHRRNMARFTHLAANCASPLLRLWLMEALEASGEAWFATTAGLAAEAEQLHGIRLDYLAGRREGPGPDGGRFRQQPLSPQACDQAMEMITVVFDAVDEQLSSSLDCAHNTCANAGQLCAP